MSTVTSTRRIPAPPEDVWAALADFAAIATWAPNADHSCLLTEQTEGPGTARRIQAGRTVLVERVVTWEPPRRLAYTIDGLPAVIRSVTSEWRLEPKGSATVASITTHVDAGHQPPRRLVARIAGRRLARAGDQMLTGLAAHLDPTRSER